MQPSDELKALMLRCYEAIARGDTAFTDRIFSPAGGVRAIGTDSKEWWGDYATIAAGFRAQAEAVGPFSLAGASPEAFREGTVGWGADQPRFRLADGSELSFRTTFVLHQENDEWKIVQWHISLGVPNESVPGMSGLA